MAEHSVHLGDNAMDSVEREKPLRTSVELAKEIRGAFIDMAIWIESLIGDMIAQQFCPDEARCFLLFSLVISNPDLKFSTKIDVFEGVLRLEHRDILDAHSDLIESLGKIRRFRNRLAHSQVDLSDEYLRHKHKDRIQVIWYEDGRKKQQVITLDEAKKRLDDWEQVMLDLMAIRRELIKRRSTTTG